MKTKYILTVLIIAGTVLILLAAATIARAIDPREELPSHGNMILSGDVASKISCQGRLTDASGNPLNGSHNFVFQLWNDVSAGSQVGSNITKNNVPVSDGLFTVELQVPQSAFNGQALWLRIQVNGQWLSPRQELLPAPYALSLRPGAVVSASIYDSPVLKIENKDANPAGGGYALVGKNASNNTWRPAIYGENTGSSAGIYGRSDGWHATVGWQAGSNPDNAGVYGHNAGAGPGVKGYGSTGVYGESSADYGQAVHGRGTGSYTEGVLGTATGAHAAAVYGIASGSGGDTQGVLGQSINGDGVEGLTDSASKSGVYGHSVNGFGVTGSSTNNKGVQGFGPTGVYGESSANYGQAVSGYGTGSHTEGILGSSVNVHGVAGYSSGTNGSLAIGVYGQTTATWGLATNQNLYVGGSCTGCTVAFVGQNVDSSTLEVGDVVVISGITSPLKGQQTPVLQVQRATADSGGALGVIQGRAAITATENPLRGSDSDQTITVEMPGLAPGTVAPNDYLFVVVQGLVQARVDASYGAIQVGDLLHPAITGGQAQLLSLSVPEMPALGRALEPLDKGSGLIWVLILGK